MSCLPLGECSRQLSAGAYEKAQLSKGKNLHEDTASSLCAMHDSHMPAIAHGMCMYVIWGRVSCGGGTYMFTYATLSEVFMTLFFPTAVLYLCICCVSEHFHSASLSEDVSVKQRRQKAAKESPQGLNNLFDVSFLTLQSV